MAKVKVKKRKLNDVEEIDGLATSISSAASTGKKHKQESNQSLDEDVDTSKPTAVYKPGQGRKYTLSVALPGSIIANAQSPNLKIMLAGQIARALAVFCVDEIVVFDDGQGPSYNSRTHDDSYTGYSNPNHFMMHILSYLETPPNLRKPLFPEHGNLSLAGTLPSLDMPHHFRAHEWCQYREGVTIEIIHSKDDQHEKSDNLKSKKKKQKSKSSTQSTTTMVNAGLLHPVSVAASIPPYTRVTLKFPDSVGEPDMSNADLTAAAIAPSVPREEGGYYWGYSVRPASSLSTVLTECPFDGGYDVTFGTSERGMPISLLNDRDSNPSPIPEFCHMLIVFGGVAGLEAAVKADAELSSMGVSKPDDLFDYWVNLCPGQGSRTIRTEEAVWLGLMGLRGTVLQRGKR